MNWNKEQQLAINSHKGNYLVSASAGSGKTGVLSARAVDLIKKENVDVNSLLILTFGEAAAKEMRERIKKELEDNGMYKEANQVDSALIMTFDAFFLKIVKTYYYILNLENDIKILDNNIINIERKRILRDILEKEYEKKEPLILDSINDYCFKNDDPIFDAILTISTTIGNRVADIDKYYENFDANFNCDQYFHELAKTRNEQVIEYLNKFISEFKNKIAKPDAFKEHFEQINSWNLINDFNSLNEVFTTKKLPRCPSKALDEDKNLFCNNVRPNYYDKAKRLLDFGDENEILDKFKDTKLRVSYFISLARKLETKLKEFKRKLNAYDFIDIARFALEILDNKEILEEIKSKISFIMVDEYQDTNDMQDSLINKLANNNLFMVGDIKQSIYGFRNANPSIFLNRYEEYGKGIVGKRIDFLENYRSREEVIDGNNKIFSRVMTKESTGIDYKNDHMMKYGNHAFERKAQGIDYSHEIYHFNDTGNKRNNRRKEIEIIANDISIKLQDPNFKILDGKSLRKAQASDFAIIVDRATNFDLFLTIFKDNNLPIKVVKELSIKENHVYKVLSNVFMLLMHILNKEEYPKHRHTLASILRSYLYSYNDDQIYEILKDESKICNSDPYVKLLDIAKDINTLSLSKLFEYILTTFDVRNRLSLLGNINDGESVINYLINFTKNFEELGFSFKDYYQFFISVKEEDIDLITSTNKENSNAITLITAHKSKGLQFPIVYYPFLNNSRGANDNLSFMKFSIYKGLELSNFNFVNEKNILSSLINQEDKKETNLEKLRLLYVALTRAKEKVIFVNMIKERSPDSFGFQWYLQNVEEGADYFNLFKLRECNENEISSLEKKIIIEEQTKEINIHNPIKMVKEKSIIHPRASKENDENAAKEALLIGNKLHHYLENVDFVTKDTSFISNKKDKKIIDKFLTLPLFNKITQDNYRHEFAFYDEEKDMLGYIDLLIIEKDFLTIIDYKTSSIDDEAYHKQLKAYASYLKKTYKKPVKACIASILRQKYKEVKVDIDE